MLFLLLEFVNSEAQVAKKMTHFTSHGGGILTILVGSMGGSIDGGTPKWFVY